MKMNVDNLLGKKFGYLRCIKLIDEMSNRGNRLAIFECDCGETSKIEITRVRRGEVGSCCGLYNRRGYIGDMSKLFVTKIKLNAKKRGLEFDITPEYMWNLFIRQNKKCALSGVNLLFKKKSRDSCENQTASLDRIDSSKGYVSGNVQWVHKRINQIKMDMSDNELLRWASLIYKYNINKKRIK